MPSVNYYNRSAPLWDFIASMEEQGASHPMFAGRGNNNEETNNTTANDENNDWPNPWTQGWPAFPFGFPHRGRGGYGPPHGHHHGPPPPPPPPAPPGHDGPPGHEKEGEAGPSEPRGPPPPFSEKPHEGPHHRGGHGSCRGRGRGGPWRAGFPGCGSRQDGRPDPRGFHPMMGGLGALANMFQEQLFGEEGTKNKEEDFKPEVDVFDTAEAFVVHVSLPGAKKEDVGVNLDAEKSELNVAGVIYRPGDEEFLKTLAMEERKIGAFERKVRLGSRANPAQVDIDGITAKMEDGVLTVEVPKLDSGYVEIKKVDIE